MKAIYASPGGEVMIAEVEGLTTPRLQVRAVPTATLTLAEARQLAHDVAAWTRKIERDALNAPRE